MTGKLLIAGLVVLNVLLGAALWQRSSEQKAFAQMGAAKRNLLIVNGVSGNSNYIYMLDLNSGVLSVSRPDPVGREIKFVAAQDVNQDLARVR